MKLTTFKSTVMSAGRIFMLLGFCLSVAGTALAEGPVREFTRTINREFGTIDNGMTALYNKYGKVNVNTWANKSVKIDITIVVNADDQRSADRMFDRIKVNFASTSGYIKAETMIEQGNGWWPGESSCQDFKINYEVWMPAGNQLDLKNKYGNSYVGALNGKLTAEIKYGDLRTETISADADINISNGKATLTKVNNIYGQISYGALALGEARDVQMDTKYSEFAVEHAGAVRLTSKYDNFILGNLGDLRLQTKYSSLKVKNATAMHVTAQYTDAKITGIAEVLDVDLSYGSMKIETLARNFTTANINAQHTDVQVNTEHGSAFRFDAQGTYTGLRYPAGATIRRHNESDSRKSVEGYVGNANAKGVVKARMNYGDFVLK